MNICPLPWIGIEAQSLGHVRPCCLYEGSIKIDNEPMLLTEYTLNEAFSSEYMQKLRLRFIAGKKPIECKKCWIEEEAGRQSKRLNSLTYIDFGKINYNDINPNRIYYLDLKLGNICNLACRVCGSWSSTNLIREETLTTTSKEEISEIQSRFKSGQWPRNNDAFWDDLKIIMPNVTLLEMTGGEPFLIKQQFELLQEVIDTGIAKNIHLHYNTNGTILPNYAFEMWPHFKIVNIAFSIDNLYEQFEFERKGAIWEEVVNNIRIFNKFKQQHNNIITQMCITISILNVLSLEKICNWIITQNFNSVYFNILHVPNSLNIQFMTPEAKKIVIDTLISGSYIPKYKKEIDEIVQFIQLGLGSDGSAFRKRTRTSDLYRNEDFSLLYPEMAKAMGYSKYE